MGQRESFSNLLASFSIVLNPPRRFTPLWTRSPRAKIRLCINESIFMAPGGRKTGEVWFGLNMSRKSQTGLTKPAGRIFLVDRHALMRQAAAEWINRCSDLEVCGMAGVIAQALRDIKRMRPDAVVSEIMQPHDLGFIRELHRRHPRLPVLVFSIHDPAEYGARARAAGAGRFLMKAAGGDKLVRSIRAILRGRFRHPAETSKRNL